MSAREVDLVEVRFPGTLLYGRDELTRSALAEVNRRSTPAAKEALRNWLQLVTDQTLQETPLNSRSGYLKQNLSSGVRVFGTDLRDLRGYIRVEPFVAAQEYGINPNTPKNARYLAIPMAPAMWPDGRPKRSGPNAWRSLGTFVMKMKDGRLFVAYRNKTVTAMGAGSASGRLVVLYRLVETTHLPARLGLRRVFDRLQGDLVDEWQSILSENIRDVFYDTAIKQVFR